MGRRGYRSPNPSETEYHKQLPNFVKMIEEKGVAWFNHFRSLNPDCKIDFKGRDIVIRDLQGIDLQGVDISGMDFHRADLTEANLDGAKCHETDFERATLDRATFRDAELKNTCFKDASLTGTNFRDAVFDGVTVNEGFAEARLAGADLRRASYFCIPAGADLSSCKLDGLILRHRDLRGTNFSCASMTSVDLRYAKINSNTVFEYARMAGAHILLSDFEVANTRGVYQNSHGQEEKGLERLAIYD